MINHFRQEMPLPIVGVGHSAGANILANLAIMHPRLMTSLVMLDPTMQLGMRSETSETGSGLASASAGRRDVWPSRASAELAFRSNKLFQSWDNRVFELWLQYGLREVPRVAPHRPGSEIILATTKHQECFTFLRPSWQGVNSSGLVFDSEAVPDLHPDSDMRYPFYRPEVAGTFSNLVHLRPAVLYLFGGKSPMSQYDAREAKVAATGAGHGGSGGPAKNNVEQFVLHDHGHLLAMEAPSACAETIAPWMDRRLQVYLAQQEKYIAWTRKNPIDKVTMSEAWSRHLAMVKRPSSSRLWRCS